ncbi:MAG TPA: hypothetical protein VIQ97_05890, partial [Prevotella sp.]
KGGRISMLTTPVSAFENWLARWVMHVPLFVVAFVLCFYAADLLRVAIFAPIFQGLHIVPCNILTAQDIELGVGDTLLFYGFFSSFFLFGGICFPKRSLLAPAVVVFFMLWYCAFVWLSAGSVMDDLFNGDAGMRLTLLRCIGFGITLFWWVLSYLRLKEIEIIDRM